MSCSQSMGANDVLALSDAQLSEFMKKHRRPNNSFELPIDNWDILSKEERNRLAQRLQLIQRALTDTPTANPRPLDLDKLDTLLRDVASGDDSLLLHQRRTRERVTESPEDPREVYKQREMEAYNNLVNNGGRPLYQIGLLESVSKDPDAYYEMLEPFWRRPRWGKPSEMDHFNSQDVLQRQWHRWQNFRKWQLNNRRINNDNEDEDDGFLAYVKKITSDFREVGWADKAAEFEADPDLLRRPGERWYHIERHRDWQRRYQRELKCESFSDYEIAVKKRLAQHGFNRPLQLAEDPKQQDRLTEWIEYLSFEYWWLDRYAASVKRLKPKHDEAWDELKRKGMVKDDETPEFVRTNASGTRCQREEDHAWQAMQDAESAMQDAESEAQKVYQRTQEDPNCLSIPKEQRIQILVKARKTLLATREAYDFTERRSNLLINFVRGTFDYADAKEDVVKQTNLVKWAVEEAHKIEAELKSATSEGHPQKKKRKASSQHVCLVQSDPKREGSLNARKHSLEPSNDNDTRDRGRLRRRNRPSTDINGQLNRDQSHNIHNTYSSQTKAGEQAPLTEANLESVTTESSSRKKRKVTFNHDPQPNLERLKPDTRASRMRRRATADMSQQLDQPQTRDTDSNVSSQLLAKGLRRSSRLAALSSGRVVRTTGP